MPPVGAQPDGYDGHSRTTSTSSSQSQDTGNSNNILLAVPKKGRLYERVLKILDGAGLDHVRAPRLDIANCTREDVTIVFLPAADIATYVAEGNVDMGITGEDIIAESQANVDVLMKLGMGKCKLCFQAPKGTVSDPSELIGKRIVTSFPNLTKTYFDKIDPGHTTSIKYVTGSVEVAPSLGLADAVVDLVETGTTMRAAGLENVGEVMRTETVLIANPHSTHHKMIQTIHKRIKGYITATQHSMITYNCPKDKIEAASKLTPGHDSPTITLLHDERFVSITALVRTKEIPLLMDRLQEIGAQSIVAIPISNCRF
ncbi:ATP phosphoribosyltransferase [Salpingoeca rosetta]|uniref:ATP phosphoribosyltransferase n=1 Tax=Salpingoeca rosetta (strain ATCC 50818 / BSB-021) TaxID=946362 RepID=F2UDU5_SALR5|nr:ATP phosphoribosyltransferase [Salpingoeca rosetta]EGD74795.1 ATP phosphoribosyltransferase [Salpingoeca rosetta]|eukprot:XP_004992440.1 ATP phosphoribosyltransferase [Salpingoeca rosetta]